MRKWTLTMGLLGVLALGPACGDDDDDGGQDTTTTTDTNTTTTTDTSVATDATADTSEPPPIHGCTTYTDATAAAADRTITFVAGVLEFDPPCLRIAAGQTVTFSGPFDSHPLDPGVSSTRPNDPPGSANNPIQTTESGTSADFTFPTAGIYPFHCDFHHGDGMVGVVLVE